MLFVEVRPGDVSEFSGILRVTGADVGRPSRAALRQPGDSQCDRRAAAVCRDETGKIPHAYFGWTEGNPIVYLLKFLVFGEGDTAPVTREVLRQAEPEPDAPAENSPRVSLSWRLGVDSIPAYASHTAHSSTP